jgi:hypothetical protein
MSRLSQALTTASIAVCLAAPTTSMAASNQAHIGVTNTSGATYINNTHYTTGGSGINIGSDITISNQLGLMLGYRTATVNSFNVSSSVSYTDIGMRYRLDNNTSTYFSANRASVPDNSETLFMLGAMHHMNLGGASKLVFSVGTSTSNLFDDLALGAGFSVPIMDVLKLNLNYQSNVTSLGKTKTTATSSGFSISINSRF